MEKVLENNYEVLKTCIEKTLHELYDLQDALDQASIHDSKSDTFKKIADYYEELRRNFIDDSMTDKDRHSLSLILDHRLEVMTKEFNQLSKALFQFKQMKLEVEKFLNS